MKNKKYLWTAVLVLTVVLALLLAGCGPGGTEFTYRVAGTASEATIKYTNADGELEETTANLPWEKTLTLGNEFSFDLTVTNQSDSGTVTCEALVDGKVLGEADSNTSVSCSGYFSKKGDSLTSAFSSAAAPSAGEHLSQGVEYAKQGQLDKAIAEFEEAIRLDPNYVKAHVNLGIAYAKQGMFDKAIAAYEEAIRLDPNIVEAHYNLGNAYAEQGMLDEAIAEYKEALKLNPDDVNTHLNLGVTYRDLGKSDEAIAEFETYLRLKPDAQNRAAVEEEIAKLKESVAGQAPEYHNAVGGYSVLYPEGWYSTESETQVEFAESRAAYEAGIDEYPIVLFTAVPLTKLAEDLGLTEITEPVSVWEAMAESFGAETGEIETFEIAGYLTAAADISGTYKGTPCKGGLAVILVEERGIIAFSLAPPDQWEAFRPTFATMLNSLSFVEP